MGIFSGIAKVASGIFGSKGRKKEQKAAKKEMAKNKKAYANLDTSNPYTSLTNAFAGLKNEMAENVFEDLTVNTKQAQFVAQQQQQSQANIMQQLQGAAGGSGIAGLAQTMANAGSVNAQQAAASIGTQEAANQKLAAQGALNVQKGEQATQQIIAQGQQQVGMKKAEGDKWSREAEAEKVGTLLGMSQQRLASANQARQDATNNILGGIGDIAGGIVTGGLTG